MNILVIGSAGRRHALVWKLAQSATWAKPATIVPGGDGTPAALLSAARSIAVDLLVVGPKALLVAGVIV